MIQSLSQDILIILQLDGREVKNQCRRRNHTHFFHFSCSAALLLRIKALALQKQPLFALFVLVGRIATILDVAMLCAVGGDVHGRPLIIANHRRDVVVAAGLP